jgi:hypothetical protein
MITVHPQYITDETGKKISVILPLKEFKTIVELLDDMEDIRLYVDAITVNEPAIPIDDAFKIIEDNRKSRNK